MKLIAIVSMLVFAGATHAASNSRYNVVCTGSTYDGMDYRLRVNYVTSPSYLGLEGPYTIILNDREINATLRASQGGDVIYRDEIQLDQLKANVTDDQTVYEYSAVNLPNGDKMENPDNWIIIAPAAGDSVAGDSFSYSLNGATGNFRNGKCEISQRRIRR